MLHSTSHWQDARWIMLQRRAASHGASHGDNLTKTAHTKVEAVSSNVLPTRSHGQLMLKMIA